MRKQNKRTGFTAVAMVLCFLAFFLTGGIAGAQNTDRTEDAKAVASEEPMPVDGTWLPEIPEEPEDFVTLSGTVRDDEGQAVQQIWVHTWSEAAGFGNGAETDESGAFSISVPEGEGYELFIDAYAIRETGLIGGFFKDADDGSGSSPGTDGKWEGSVTGEWESRTLLSVGADGLSGVVIALGTGSKIFGKVLDADGKAVADIWIDASSENKGGWGGDVTDADGAFSITVPPGDGYRVSSWPWSGIFAGGFWQAGEDSPLTKSGQDGVLIGDWDSATLVNAGSDQEINIIVPRPTTISGRVVDKNGEPVSGIMVEAVSGNPFTDRIGIAEDSGDEENEDLQQINIDEDGFTALPAVMPNVDILVPADEENEDVQQTDIDEDNLVVLPAVMPSVDILAPADGETDTAACVFAPTYWHTAITDENGNYEIIVTPASDYRVSVPGNGIYQTVFYNSVNNWDEATLIDASSSSVNGIDFSVDMGKSVSGTVTGLAEGDTVFIDVWGTSGQSGEDAFIGRGNAVVTGTSVTGTGSDVPFKVRGLADGSDYRIHVWAEGYLRGYLRSDGTFGTSQEDAALFSAGTADIVIAMSTGNKISGTIFGLGEGEQVWIDARSKSAGSRGSAEVTKTEGNVTYTISGLAPATDYVVTFSPEKHVREIKTGVDSSSNPVDVNFTASDGASISGTITGATPNQPVWINAWSKSTWEGGFTEVQADENGEAVYEIGCLMLAADYRVTASGGSKNLIYNQQTEWEKADNVDLTAGSVTGISFDFSVIESYTVTGTVTGLDETTSVWIDAWDESGGAWGATEVRGNGEFTLELPAGNYKIGFYAGEYQALYFDAESGSLITDWAAAKSVALSADQNIGTVTFTDEFKWGSCEPYPEPILLSDAAEEADEAGVEILPAGEVISGWDWTDIEVTEDIGLEPEVFGEWLDDGAFEDLFNG